MSPLFVAGLGTGAVLAALAFFFWRSIVHINSDDAPFFPRPWRRRSNKAKGEE